MQAPSFGTVDMQPQLLEKANYSNLTSQFMARLPEQMRMGWDESNQDDILRIPSNRAFWKMLLIIPDVLVAALVIRRYLVL
jgi:hypothetical protein